MIFLTIFEKSSMSIFGFLAPHFRHKESFIGGIAIELIQKCNNYDELLQHRLTAAISSRRACSVCRPPSSDRQIASGPETKGNSFFRFR